MSAWELAPFAQALFGYPLNFPLAREIDNPRVDALSRALPVSGGKFAD